MILNIYTDGSATPNGSGWAVYIKELSILLGNSLENATNNQAELTAIINALSFCYHLDNINEYDEVIINTDSQYCIGILTKDWKVNCNEDLIRELKCLKQELEVLTTITFNWVKGHNKDQFNELCDTIAQFYSSKNENK